MYRDRRRSREHERRPSTESGRLQLEEVKLRRTSTETNAAKAVAVKYVCFGKMWHKT